MQITLLSIPDAQPVDSWANLPPADQAKPTQFQFDFWVWVLVVVSWILVPGMPGYMLALDTTNGIA